MTIKYCKEYNYTVLAMQLACKYMDLTVVHVELGVRILARANETANYTV